jgi:hypothetical protein
MTHEAAKTDATVFDVPPAEAKTADPGTSSLVNELVGPGKKFKDLDALAKSKLESDAFIKQVQAENEGLRKDLEKRLKAEEALEALRNQPQTQEPAQPAAVPDQKSISEIVRQEMSEAEKAKAFEKNVLEANDYIIKKVGSKEAAVKFIQEKATELGVQKEWLFDMAGRSPKALYNLLGVQPEVKPAQPSPVIQKSSINTSAPPADAPKTKAHFEELRRTNPSQYWDSKTQNEIFKLKREGRYD